MTRRISLWPLMAAAALPLAAPAMPRTADGGKDAAPAPGPEGAVALTQAENERLLNLAMKLMQSAEPAEALSKIDEELAREPRAGLMRAHLLVLRSSMLGELNRWDDAAAAAEDAVRLAPGAAEPMWQAFDAYLYSDKPVQASEMLLRASKIDPSSARELQSYDVSGLIRRLRNIDDNSRLLEVVERLDSIDWRGDDLDTRSLVAQVLIEGRIKQGKIDAAKAAIPKLIDPADLRSLLINRDMAALWPALEEWGGPKMAAVWHQYLSESEARWNVDRSAARASEYSAVLQSAGHHHAMVREFAGMFDHGIDPEESSDLVFVAPRLASAYAMLGKFEDAENIYTLAEKIWPLGSGAMALNVSANHAVLSLSMDRPEEALRLIDEAIADTKKWGGEVNGDAKAGMMQTRICALYQLGRKDEARAHLTAIGLNGGRFALITAHLCVDDVDGAASLLAEALADPDQRRRALGFLQPDDDKVFPSKYGRWRQERSDAIRNTPRLRALGEQVGRIMSYSINAGAGPDVEIRPGMDSSV